MNERGFPILNVATVRNLVVFVGVVVVVCWIFDFSFFVVFCSLLDIGIAGAVFVVHFRFQTVVPKSIKIVFVVVGCSLYWGISA